MIKRFRHRGPCSTVADTLPFPDGKGGVWRVECESCGWVRRGTYEQTCADAEYGALVVAGALGLRHETR